MRKLGFMDCRKEKLMGPLIYVPKRTWQQNKKGERGKAEKHDQTD